MGGIVGRKRSRTTKQWPKGVYRKRDTLIYREYLGVVDGKTKFGPDVYLCELTDPASKLHQAYERITQHDQGSINWLLKQYHESPQFKKLSPRTQSDYPEYQRLLTAYIMGNGRAFGEAPLTCVKRTTLRGYLDKYGAPIAANRHIQYLKAAWNWGLERFDNIPDNPCQGVKLNEQKPRDRYVTDEEYATTISLAGGYLPIAMELAYLQRARRGEVFGLMTTALLDEGVRLERAKGSEGEITAYSDRLRAAIKAAQQFNADAPTPITGAFLIHNKHGRPITKNAFDSAWQRLMAKAKKAGVPHFTFHDLKAKGISDHKTNFGGHRDKSGKMRRTYVRKLQLVQPPA
jgi:integrase